MIAGRVCLVGVDDDDAVARIATRMRLTLVEVLGAARGEAMYSLDWLEARVRWHLDRQPEAAAVLGAFVGGDLVGHTLVRIEAGADGVDHGLFSTTYVDPAHRRGGVAGALLDAGEDWMRSRALRRSVTYTDADNAKLIALYRGRGYGLHPEADHFVRLQRPLER